MLRLLLIISYSTFLSQCFIHGNDKKSVTPPILSNGVIKLIIKTYVNEILKTNELNEIGIRKKLLSLSDHISSHPAIHQKYLWVGAKPPMEYDPDNSVKDKKSTVRYTGNPKKRSETTQFPSEEICKTNRQWEQINSTRDFYDNPVDIVQDEDLQQFVFSYRCATKGSCIGISPFYESECAERNGWMYMYYINKNSKTRQWGYVSAPHHCACKIQPKFGPTGALPPNEEELKSIE